MGQRRTSEHAQARDSGVYVCNAAIQFVHTHSHSHSYEQCVKLLSDTNVPQFYPSMFVRISDVLNMFGTMVYERLKKKAEDSLTGNGHRRVKLRDAFSAADIPSEAKETCRNWFYKTACIREVLPRIYVEIALLPCYQFLTDSEYPQILSRLSSIIR